MELLEGGVRRGGGEVVDQSTDELLCTFPTLGHAIEAAVTLQRTLRSAKQSGRFPIDLEFRVGVHYGPVLALHRKVFGGSVKMAKRMLTIAQGGQIVTTREALDVLPDRNSIEIRPLGNRTVGEVVEVHWRGSRATRVETDTEFGSEPPAKELLVRYRDRKIRLDPTEPILTIGREPNCDLVVEHPEVSRYHARIELGRSEFTLTDMSTNGTQIVSDDGRRRTLKHQQSRLAGEGALVLGKGRFAEAPAIRYRLVSEAGSNEFPSTDPSA